MPFRAPLDALKEIVPALKPEESLAEANRCLYCYDAPCATACPTHIDIPLFIKQIASGNLAGSAKTILEANPFGHSCARACPVEVLCEGACVYHEWQKRPIEIGRLQRRATDALHKDGGVPFSPGAPNGLKVAVIGAGPSGLSCATYLRRLGYAVTVFEKGKTPGGLNSFGIADYKMTQKVSLDEISLIQKFGVDIRLGVEIGSDIPAARLLKDYDALFIGIGLGPTHELGIPGEKIKGVWDALSFIRLVKERRFSALGKSAATIVIGAGNTSIDAVTQSKRTGTPRVIMAYRRSESEMKAYGFEYALAKSDGAEFLWNVQPLRIIGKKKVEAIEFQKTDGRKERLIVSCDRVIKAIGQSKLTELAKSLGLKLASDGRIAVAAKTLQTSSDTIFAGGDAINGGKEVVNAAADGKRAAYAINCKLRPGAPVGAENEYWIKTIDPTPLPRIGRHAPEIRGQALTL